jgi:hypothetical protein
MGEMAKREPGRFARLAVRIPKGSFPGYLSHIVDALSLCDPPDTVKETASSWEQATASEIEAVLDHVGYSEDRNQAMSYCRLIRTRADIDWSESALRQLARYAIEHPHPDRDEWTVGSHDSKGNTIPDVVNTSINCVRGCAAMTVSTLLFARRHVPDALKPTLERLVEDEATAVRISATTVCLAMLNIDRDEATRLFVRLCSTPDDRVFEGHYASEFIAYARRSHFDDLGQIIERMVHSENEKVAHVGAGWAAGEWVSQKRMTGLLDECRSGSMPQRKALADVAAGWIKHDGYDERCLQLLKSLMDDDDAEVRQEACSVFRNAESLDIDGVPELSRLWMESKAFEDGLQDFVLGVDQYTGRLEPYTEAILRVCEAVSKGIQVRRGSREFTFYEVRELSKIVLRLYEQSQGSRNTVVQLACLDALDGMLEARVSDVRSLIDEIES